MQARCTIDNFIVMRLSAFYCHMHEASLDIGLLSPIYRSLNSFEVESQRS